MKKLITILLVFFASFALGQSPIWHLGKVGMKYANPTVNDTLLIQFSGDTVLYNSTSNPFHKFAQPIMVDSIRLNGIWGKNFGYWSKTGSDIYYNDGNVGINNASPTYKLDVGGLIGGSNIETNLTSLSTKLGYEAGINEVETDVNANTFIGYQSGYNTSAGVGNTYIGYMAGYSSTIPTNNVFIGINSGKNTTIGSTNVFIGNNSGGLNVDGNSNVAIGGNTNYYCISGEKNIIIGTDAGQYNTKSNRLIISNFDSGSEANDSTKSIIYGVMNADTLNQFVDINGALYHTAILAEIYKTGTTVAQSIPAGTTPTKVTAFTDNKYGIHCTADAANDKITITKAGYYDFKLGLSYQIGTAGVTFTAHIFVNGVEDVSLHSTGKPATANDPRSTAVVGTIHVTTVPCDVDYRVTHDNGGSVNISFDYCNMAVNYIGE